MWNDWPSFWRALFGTPRRAGITIVIIIIAVLTGLVKLIFASVIAPLISFLLVLFFIGVVLRIAFGRGRPRGNGH